MEQAVHETNKTQKLPMTYKVVSDKEKIMLQGLRLQMIKDIFFGAFR